MSDRFDREPIDRHTAFIDGDVTWYETKLTQLSKLLMDVHYDGEIPRGERLFYANPTEEEWIERRDELIRELGYDQ